MFHVEHFIKDVFLRKKFLLYALNNLTTEGGKLGVNFSFFILSVFSGRNYGIEPTL